MMAKVKGSSDDAMLRGYNVFLVQRLIAMTSLTKLALILHIAMSLIKVHYAFTIIICKKISEDNTTTHYFLYKK